MGDELYLYKYRWILKERQNNHICNPYKLLSFSRLILSKKKNVLEIQILTTAWRALPKIILWYIFLSIEQQE